MHRRNFLRITAGGAGAAAFLRSASAAVAMAGFAEADITPEIGMEQPGGYGKVFLKTLHDACKVRASVFDDGHRRVALVGIDALMVPRALVLEARKEIHERCGIAPESVLIGASHSHSSGPTGMVQPGEYDDASALVRKLAYEDSSCADARYLKTVREQIIKAVCQADSSRKELLLGVGSGHEASVSFNRRFRMKNGRAVTHPGQGNPDIVRPAGPIDPEVGVIGAWDASGKLAGCVVNFACHATTNPGPAMISANWVYYLENTIRALYGENVPVVFLQGACGDITQVNNLNPQHQPSGEDWSRLVGGAVGAETSKVLVSMPRRNLTPVDAAATVLRIRRRVPNPERVERCRAIVQGDPKAVPAADWTFAKEIVLLDALLKREPVAEVEVQAVQIGPAVFISNPAELFVEFGLTLKKESPFRYTFPVELANGCVGYVPTGEALDPATGGGYETRLTSYSNLEPAAGSQMVQAGLALARKMKPGPIPEPEKPPAFKQAWPYGNVPPELH